MKKFRKIPVIVFTFLLSLSLMVACSKNDENDEIEIVDSTIVKVDEDALLFMIEEEKLARDTYIFLGNLWSINQFNNIKNSEQTHMNAIENLLKKYKINYTILPVGEFANQDLQNYYNQFIKDGAINKSNALQIGATIEDLDIVDLQDYMDASKSADLISVFESLQCASRNHLRSFLKAIEKNGDTYTPQFLSQTTYNAIIKSSNEQCN